VSIQGVSLADKKSIIIDFLRKCNAFSEQKLQDYERRMVKAEEAESIELDHKKHDWSSYKSFNNYAINKLKGNELDDWL